MSQSSDRADRDERLHAALHQGDPAAGEPGLAPEEVHAMRRTVLTALPEPRRAVRLIPAFALTAAVALAFVLGLAVWRSLGPDPAPPAPRVADRPAAPAPAPQAPKAPVAPEPPVRIAAASAEPALQPVRPRRMHRAVHRTAPVSPIPSAPDRPVEEAYTEEPLTRQVQLTAPGGTRIIWMLTEESHSR
jgi:hypothetical protein